MSVEDGSQRKARMRFLEAEGIEVFNGERAAEVAKVEPVMGRNDAALAAFSAATGFEAITKERRLPKSF